MSYRAAPLDTFPVSNFFERVLDAILESDPQEKCSRAQQLFSHPDLQEANHSAAARSISAPGHPEELELVSPKHLKRRSMNSQTGRNILMHAIAHIEFNAINLALDAAYRFRNQSDAYYQDWLSVAADEARHFLMIDAYLVINHSYYGEYPVHNGLWEMAVDTDHDVLARMALVPRVLEARGLDVTPSMIEKLTHAGDQAAADILLTIYEDEIGHVGIGSKWFLYHCKERGLEPRSTFRELVATHLHGELRGPFNEEARLLAGFDAEELAALDAN